jgi:ribonuclease T2
MPSTVQMLFALSVASLAAATTSISSLVPRVFDQSVSSGCSNTGPASCSNTTVVADTCCFEANGQLLLVQFWDSVSGLYHKHDISEG